MPHEADAGHNWPARPAGHQAGQADHQAGQRGHDAGTPARAGSEGRQGRLCRDDAVPPQTKLPHIYTQYRTSIVQLILYSLNPNIGITRHHTSTPRALPAILTDAALPHRLTTDSAIVIKKRR